MVRKTLLSILGMILSVIGIIGVIFSQLMFEMLLFVITAISGLFTLSLQYNDNEIGS
jgi:hypothetical protein